NVACRPGVSFKPVAELFGHRRVDVPADLGVAELGLGLAFELGFGNFDRNDGGKTLADVVTGEVFVFVPQDLLLARVSIDQRGQRPAEAFLVGSTVVGVDRVGVGVNRFGVCGGPLHGHLDGHALINVFFFEGDDIIVNQLSTFGFVQVRDIVKQPVFVHVVDETHRLFFGLVA